MRWSRSRTLGVGGFAAGLAAVAVAVLSALGPQNGTGGVAAASVTIARSVTHQVDVAGVRVAVTVRPNGGACYRAPGIAACAGHLRSDEISYAVSAPANGRQQLGGIAGPTVRAVIARLTGKGTVWPALHDGAFYATLPRGRRLRAIVKVLPGGKRQIFSAR
jgi:hypothetical protein